ncbi:MAG: NAD(P)H-dependent glycerol-3-phosphate dehydrogenase [Gammaproteobacteria bacterium]|nr:NAD(P)H-dependent glycerol-3-phosphate dehydrogenase [Gammaproteobacteria bacterium]|tara:strand:+ start:111329 stop:112360 length:1032 start_codon:yes stop_codon:yes gene_type:complete
MKVKDVAVLGGGSFGTVIANIIAHNGHKTKLWMRDAQQVEILNRDRENPNYLPGYTLHENIQAIQDLEAAIADADMIFVAVPSTSFRDVVSQMKPFLREGTILVSLTKGIEAANFSLMSQILSEELPDSKVAVVSGPNLAKEIATLSPTGAVVASTDAEVRKEVQETLRSANFRVYANDDMLGVELGGSLKNIYAIMAGLADARGMGHNTNSMLVTRSLTEMARFGVALGADPMTFLGLSGVGDLIVTCSTPLSRNFRVGKALGEGKSLESILAELGQVAEGVNTLKLVVDKAASIGVEMPLAQALYEIIYNNQDIEHIINSVLLEEQGLDVEFEVGRAKQLM